VISHEKVFNEAMCTQDDVYLLIFFIRVFYKRDKNDIYYASSVSPKLCQGVIGVFHSIQDQVPSFFS
jgi:hypothetical protein